MSTPVTVESIRDTLINTFELAFGQVIAYLPKNFTRVLSAAVAAVVVLAYKYAGFIFLQLFIKTATIEEIEIFGKRISPLLEWGRLIGVGDPDEGTQAAYICVLDVFTPGGTMPINTQFLGKNGVTYLTTYEVSLEEENLATSGDNWIAFFIVQASEDPNGTGGVGEIGNLSAGVDELSVVVSRSNYARSAITLQEQVRGVDGEDTQSYRARVQERWAKRRQGGAYVDYRDWGENREIGVRRIFVYTGDPLEVGGKPGQVDVYVEAIVTETNPDGIPSQGVLDSVAEAIELDNAGLASRRPASAYVNVLPIFRSGFSITVVGLQVPSNQQQAEADIEAALDEYMLDREQFIVGLSVLPKKNEVNNARITGIVEDIVTAAGGTFTGTSFEKDDDPGPRRTYVLVEGESAKLTSVSYQA